MTGSFKFPSSPGLVPLGLFALLFLPMLTAAQYRFDSWTTDNGLPQGSVNSILQTRDGFLWLTTYGGLVRYDGMRFQVFNTGNTKGLRTGRFLRMFEDSEGALWISTEGQGVTKYKDGEFVSYTVEDGLGSNWIDRISADANGNILFYSADQVTEWDNERFSPYLPAENEPVKNVFQRTPGGPIWYADGSNLRRYGNGRVTVDFPLGFIPRRVVEDSSGRVWMAGNGNKLSMLKDNKLTVYSEKDGYPPDVLNMTYEDRQNRLWFGTRGGGLLLFEDGKFTPFTTKNGLVGDDVAWMFEDREGTFWIGTVAGLSRMTERNITAYSKQDGLAGDNVYPIYEDRKGRIWIGSWRGLTVYENGTFTDVGKQYGVDDVLVTSLLEDSEGALWIGSWSEGVRRVKDGKVTLFPPQGLPGTLVRAIVEDRSGNIWFGVGDNRLVRYKDGIFTSYTGGLSGAEIFVIHEDRQGQLWIGTDKGLNKFKDGVVTAFTENDGIANNIVRAIHEDTEGTLWIGMYDSGLYRYKEGRFTHFGSTDGLFDNGAFQIIEDARNNFWISCNLGIYSVKRSELSQFADGVLGKITSVPYNRRDGMLSSECNGAGQPAGILTKGGKIWFPTQKGVVVIDPSTIPFNTEPPPVVIESLMIDSKPADVRKSMDIQPDQTNIEIHYSGLSFINPELVKFRYKLEGLDGDWIDADSRRTAFYSHLPPGDYRFLVTAANRDGVWNEQGATIGITVLPPFWRTRWFTGLMSLFVLSLGFAIYKTRISQLKREQRKQEAFSHRMIELQETERKRIAHELHDGLGQTLVVIKNRAWITLQEPTNQAQAFDQMEEIADAADQSLSEVREIAYNLRPFLIDRSGLTSAIETLVRKSAPPDLHITAELDNIDNLLAPEMEINLYRIVQECLNNMIKHAGATAASVIVKRPGDGIEITVSDNGKGFDTAAIRFGNSTGGSGFGLVGITERAKILGAVPVIESAPGKGTRIYLRLSAGIDPDAGVSGNLASK